MGEVPSTLLYQPSGRAPIFGLALGGIAAFGVALVSAPIYAYATVYCPVVQLSVLLTLIYGAVLGGVPALAMVRLGKVRNNVLTVLVALGTSALGWLVSWVPWLYATMNRNADVPLFVILDPLAFTQMVRSIYELGSWSIGSSNEAVSGLLLLPIWLIEFGLIVGTGALVGFGVGEGGPFCERCEAWCKNVGVLMHLPVELEAAIVPRLLSGDVAALTDAAQLTPPYAPPTLQVLGTRCPSCRDTATLLVQRVDTTRDAKGNVTEHRVDLVRHLMVRASDVEWAQGGARGHRPRA